MWLISCTDEETNLSRATTGVNDVRAACEVRARWTRRDSGDCAACRAAVVLPPCGCELFRDVEARCVTLADARRRQPQCTQALDACVSTCPPNDCGCLDHCFEGADDCRQATSARDGCITEVCTPYCE
ncbi:MAG: hypothetical protein RMJ98_05605 [Myxococcales bacterium]|nr:hypothetical protein [Polyangiaceae bacterium]MDW8248767.1 hypothetical protein [Myxococcales bacterium]